MDEQYSIEIGVDQQTNAPCVWRSGRAGMLPDVTECDDSGRQGALSTRQLRAMQLILLGWSDPRVGRALGVSRVTIFRWRHNNQIFREELMRQRRQVWRQAGDRLRSLIAPTLALLEQRLADPKTQMRAIEVLLRLAAPRGKNLSPPSVKDQQQLEADADEAEFDLPEEILGDADVEHGDSRLTPPEPRPADVLTPMQQLRQQWREEDAEDRRRRGRPAWDEARVAAVEGPAAKDTPPAAPDDARPASDGARPAPNEARPPSHDARAASDASRPASAESPALDEALRASDEARAAQDDAQAAPADPPHS